MGQGAEDLDMQWATESIRGRSPDFPLPTLEWPGDEKPPSWWGRGPDGTLTKVYRDYAAYCDD